MDQVNFKSLKHYISTKVKLTKVNLEEKSASLSTLYFYCIDIYSDEFKIYKDMKVDAESTYGRLYKKYAYGSNLQLKTKNEVEAHIWSDEEYFNHMKNLNHQEAVVRFLEETITMVKQIGFTIKNMIEIQRVKSGG
jgi:hypothetical protein